MVERFNCVFFTGVILGLEPISGETLLVFFFVEVNSKIVLELEQGYFSNLGTTPGMCLTCTRFVMDSKGGLWRFLSFMVYHISSLGLKCRI